MRQNRETSGARSFRPITPSEVIGAVTMKVYCRTAIATWNNRNGGTNDVHVAAIAKMVKEYTASETQRPHPPSDTRFVFTMHIGVAKHAILRSINTGIMPSRAHAGTSPRTLPPPAFTPDVSNEDGHADHTTRDTAPRIPRVIKFGIAPEANVAVNSFTAATPTPWMQNRNRRIHQMHPAHVVIGVARHATTEEACNAEDCGCQPTDPLF